VKLHPALPTLGTGPRTVASGPDSWRSGRTTAERGYGGKWQRARGFFLQRNPLCRFCDAAGRTELASVVDHIKPHQGDMKLFWDRDNWQPLCKPCHDSTKKMIEGGKLPTARIGLDGWPEA
jgi:5-methylcytosine-specific restriction endonuclease McrA